MPQGGEGVRGPQFVTQGGTIEVDVGPSDNEVHIGVGGPTTRQSVEPGKRASIPVPPAPPGTLVYVRIGDGLRRRVLFFEIIAPGP